VGLAVEPLEFLFLFRKERQHGERCAHLNVVVVEKPAVFLRNSPSFLSRCFLYTT
jgi:hypothetical protein